MNLNNTESHTLTGSYNIILSEHITGSLNKTKSYNITGSHITAVCDNVTESYNTTDIHKGCRDAFYQIEESQYHRESQHHSES